MTPRVARLKQRVRAAIDICGGIDGAAATTARARQTSGSWNNLNDPAFPPADCAMALDAVAISQGRMPPILSGMAAELGCVVMLLPEPDGSSDGLADSLAEATGEFGDIARVLVEAKRDRTIDRPERDRIVREIDEAMQSLAKMRALAAGEG